MNVQRGVLIALCIPAVALAGELGPDSALSAWHAAGMADKLRLVDTMAGQLQTSAGATGVVDIPHAVVMGCVDRNRTPDQLTVNDHVVGVTSGMATVLCLKMHVPALRTARYSIEGAPASGR